MHTYIHIIIYIYIYIYNSTVFSPPNASAQWQPDGLTIHANKWFLGAGFLGAPPISLIIRLLTQNKSLSIYLSIYLSFYL